MKKNIIVLLLISISVCCHAQVGVNTTNPNAQLDIRSSNQASPNATDGMLVPKVDVFPTGVNANQDAMLVYLTTTVGTDIPGFYYYNHATTSWLSVGKGAEKLDDLIDGKSDSDGSENGSSVFVGIDAGAVDNESDNKNVGIGFESLLSSTSGVRNVAVGYQSLTNDDSSYENVAIGFRSLEDNNGGSLNVAIGAYALNQNGQANDNVAIGAYALYNNIGSGQVANGKYALFSNTDGQFNVANGQKALYANVNGSGNVANGYEALYSNRADYNVANGYYALFYNLSGAYNVATGAFSMSNNTSGSYNVAMGSEALFENITGNNNVALGYQALYSNTASENTAIGSWSLQNNTTGNRNTSVGIASLRNNSIGSNNTAIGRQSLESNTEGFDNVGVGAFTLWDNTEGIKNVAIGNSALADNTTANLNTAIGNHALRLNTTGFANSAIGTSALYNNNSGNYNTAVGNSAGLNSLGSNNVFLGSLAGSNETGSNILYIENSSADANNALIYGEFDTDLLRVNGNLEISGVTNLHRNVATGVALRVNGAETLWYNGTYFSWGYGGTANYFADNVGMGTTTPDTRIHVEGGTDVSPAGGGFITFGSLTGWNIAIDDNEIMARNNGVVSDLNLQAEGGNVWVGGAIVHASDRRLKKDIEALEYGLKDLQLLQPKQYHWKNRKSTTYKSFGLIAQNVQKVIPELVLKQNDTAGTLSVNYTELIPVLINAIQEQQHKIKTLEAELESIKSLEARILALEAHRSK